MSSSAAFAGSHLVRLYAHQKGAFEFGGGGCVEEIGHQWNEKGNPLCPGASTMVPIQPRGPS
jgi:hypothetical protein